MELTKEEALEIVEVCSSLTAAAKFLGLPVNGRTNEKVKQALAAHGFHLHGKSGHSVKYPIGEKECPVCGEVFLAKIGSPKEKTTCSHSCANSLYPKRSVEGACKSCGLPLPKQRSFCKECRHAARVRKHNVVKRTVKRTVKSENHTVRDYSYLRKDFSDWLKGVSTASACGKKGHLTETAKNALKEHRGWKCEQCGWNEINPETGKVPVQVDHKDGCWKNNHIDNLRVLCPNCHSLTPTYGSLNRGNGRPEKLDYYHTNKDRDDLRLT